MTTDLTRNLALILAGKTFIGGAAGASGTANYAHYGLYNPVGSGVRGVITTINFSVDTESAVYLATYHAPLANLPETEINKRSLGGAGKLQLSYEHVPTRLGDLIFQGFYLDAKNSWSYDLSSFPIVLEEGKGMLIRTSAVNLAFSVSFQWVEITG